MQFSILSRFIFLLCLLIWIPLSAQPGYWEPWGKDTDLKTEDTSTQEPASRLSPMAKIAEQIILFHHKVITPIDGPRSHFRPTSSRYMLLAIRRHGFVKGFIMGCDRLLRENGDEWVYRKIEINGKLYKHDPIKQ